MSGDPSDESAARRAARREFIRSAHPDRGGDPDAFISGLASFDPGRARASYGERPRVQRSRRPDRIVVVLVRRLRRRLAGQPPRNLK